MKSTLTLESLPTPEQIYGDMVRLYVEEYGHDHLYDVYKILLPIEPQKIGIELFSVIEETNQREMVKNGYCPDCGVQLRIKSYLQTHDSPGAEWIECPSCHDEFAEVG